MAATDDSVITTVDNGASQVIIGFEPADQSDIRAAVAVGHAAGLSLQEREAVVDELREPIAEVLGGDLP